MYTLQKNEKQKKKKRKTKQKQKNNHILYVSVLKYIKILNMYFIIYYMIYINI